MDRAHRDVFGLHDIKTIDVTYVINSLKYADMATKLVNLRP